ncbi:hypothetical protein Pla108_37800 [Botrimarina colliarenosi]|uniref:Chromosome partition protein Smc n=2 Tax=Botrimarina colliarenosi TaxID=2528001 RepID=A0A5C6A471_9BACT|nr:hypothetical protein Pla108_37800 [Botrimarina colliarenosi]
MGRTTVPTTLALALATLAAPTCLAEDTPAATKQAEVLQHLRAYSRRLDDAIREKTDTLQQLQQDAGQPSNETLEFRVRLASDRLRRLEERKVDAEERLLRTRHAAAAESDSTEQKEVNFLEEWIAALDDKIDGATAALDLLLESNPDFERRRAEIDRLCSQQDRIEAKIFEVNMVGLVASTD